MISTDNFNINTTTNEQKYLEAANGKLKFMDGGIRTTNERNKTRFTSSSNSEEEEEEEEEEQTLVKSKEEEEIEFAARRKLAIAAAESQLKHN